MRHRATIVGFSAIVMWAFLALLTAASGAVPPFQLAALCFTIGALIGLVVVLRDPARLQNLKQPLPVWILGTGGIFGYHFLYFTALRNAPAVEAGLIAYLWPLFIVLGSAFLPGERIRWFHVAGALLGLLGTVIIVAGNGVSVDSSAILGYLAAFLCAFTWSGYSLLSRRFGEVPTDAVTGFCVIAALLSLVSHLVLETTAWPIDLGEWLAVLGLGLFPVGAAFYVWDFGVKHGDIQVLGAASYAAPLLSTLVLIGAGFAEPSLRIALACLLITGGAFLAAKSLLFDAKTKDGGAVQ